MVTWSEHTKHTLPFNCSNTTKDKTKARKARRRVLIISKARRHVGVPTRKVRNNYGKGAQFSRIGKHLCQSLLFNTVAGWGLQVY